MVAVDQDQLDLIAGTIADLYREVESALITTIANELKKDLPHPAAEVKLDAIRRLRAAAVAVQARLQKTRSEKVREAIRTAYRSGHMSALTSIPTDVMLKIGAKQALEQVPNAALVENLAAAVHRDLGRVDGNILRAPEDAYRAVQAATAARIATGTETRRDASQAAWQRLMDRGITSFTDKSGRTWRLSSYVEMMGRTNVARAAVQGQMDRLASLGLDLVYISDNSQECKVCRPYESKVLRRDAGPIGKIKVEHRTRDNVMVTVDVLDTLDGARAKGLFHPNCRHSASAYLPGVTKLKENTADPEGDKARQRQRALERKIRAAKEQELGALTPAAKKQAGADVRAAQKQLRDHLKANPKLKRLTYREQIGGGNTPGPGGPKGGAVGDIEPPKDGGPTPKAKAKPDPEAAAAKKAAAAKAKADKETAAEQARTESERAAQEKARLEAEQAEEARLAQEQAAAQAEAKAKADQARLTIQAAEKARLKAQAAERAEADRLVRAQAEKAAAKAAAQAAEDAQAAAKAAEVAAAKTALAKARALAQAEAKAKKKATQTAAKPGKEIGVDTRGAVLRVGDDVTVSGKPGRVVGKGAHGALRVEVDGKEQDASPLNIRSVRGAEASKQAAATAAKAKAEQAAATAARVKELENLYGNRLRIQKGSKFGPQHARDFGRIPDAFHDLLAKHVVGGVDLGDGSVADFKPELRGVQPRGWPPGKTWDDCTAGYDPTERRIMVGSDEDEHGHGATSVCAHETGHAVDHALDDASFKQAWRILHDEAKSKGVRPYFAQAGEAGQQEAWAEAFASWTMHRGDPPAQRDLALGQALGIPRAKAAEIGGRLADYFNNLHARLG